MLSFGLGLGLYVQEHGFAGLSVDGLKPAARAYLPKIDGETVDGQFLYALGLAHLAFGEVQEEVFCCFGSIDHVEFS